MPAVSPHSPQGQLSRVPYLPGLDGMRALAVGAVMVYHANHGWLPGGFIGVEVFFVISGYLITLLLLGEEERAGFINLTAFWTRRFRRLLPALLTMLTLLGMYMAFTRDKAMGRTRGDFVAGFPFYSSNWYQIWVGQGYTASEAFVPLRHLWSLAVEEQFYLIWPVLMLFLLRNRNRGSQVRLGLRFATIAVGISVVMAALYAGGDIQTSCSPDQMNGYWRVFGRCLSINDTLYLSSFTRASGILLGGALAMLWRPAALERSKVAGLGQRLTLIGLGGVAVLAVLAATLTIEGDGEQFGVRFNPWLFRGGLLLVGLATVAVIMAVTHKGSELGRWLGHPILNWIGTRSYGLYLYHWPIYQIIRHQAGLQLSLGQFVLAMAITLPLTEASYRFIETPIRQGKLGDWWQRTRRDGRSLVAAAAVATLALFSGISIATADNRCVGAVECSLEAADDTGVPATDPPGGTPSGTVEPQPTTPPGNSTPGATVPPGSTPAGTKPYAAFGESVMAGAVAPLRSGRGIVYVKEGMQGKALITRLKAVLAEGSIGPTTPVAIHIGTNGTVTKDDFDQIMALLPSQPVVFLTVRAPGKSWIDGNNELIRALPAAHSNVSVLDWATESTKLTLCKDKIHISCNSKTIRAYANLIFKAMGLTALVK